MNHVMVDLETFGVGRDAAIIAIAAVQFDPRAGLVNSETALYERIDLKRSRYPGRIDASTVEWWLRQDDAARKALTSEPRRSLEDALAFLGTWILNTSRDAGEARTSLRFWSHGPTFDEQLLRDACARHDWKLPVHYRASRCYRTLLDLAGASGFDMKRLPRPSTSHDALADAIAQASGACLMIQYLTRNP